MQEQKGMDKGYLQASGKSLQREQLKRKRRVNRFVRYAVKKPILFVTYILLGLSALLIISLKIRVPVYTTYQGECKAGADNEVIIDLNNTKIDSEKPIYIYISRDDYIVKTDHYQVQDSLLIISDDINSFVGKEVSVDVEVKEVTLLEMAIRGGGNQ